MSERAGLMLSEIWPFVVLFFAGGGLIMAFEHQRIIVCIAIGLMVIGFFGMQPWIAPPELGGRPL